MFRTLTGLSAAMAVLVASVAAHALTVTNRDTTVHTVTVEEGIEDQESAVIQPSATKNDFCAKGCTISLYGGQIMKLKGDETLVIENGQIKKM